MKYERSKVNLPRLKILFKLGVFVLAGALAALAAPPTFVGRCTLYFPSLNVVLCQQVAKLCRHDESYRPSVWAGDAQKVQLAGQVLHSRSALNYALSQTKVEVPSYSRLWGEDPESSFLKRQVHVEVASSATIHLTVRFNQSEAAGALCQSIVDYYTQSESDYQATNTKLVQARVKQALIVMDLQLSDLERKMSLVQGRRVRRQSGGQTPAGSARKPRRSADVEAKREYEESLTGYRSELVHYDFLNTWRALEELEYIVIDPVTVYREGRFSRLVGGMVTGFLLGLLVLSRFR